MLTDDTPTAVYRLYDANRVLLYIGITVNLEQRFAAHRGEKPWWPQVTVNSVQWYLTRTEAAAEELRAIRAEDPLHNVKGHADYLGRLKRGGQLIAHGATRRIIVNARLSRSDIASIDALAEENDRTRSDMVRILLDEAIAARAAAGTLPPID